MQWKITQTLPVQLCPLTISLPIPLTLIESFFSKMTKQMLKGIRGTSKEELANRIYLYSDEVNREPVIYRWTYKMEETTFLFLILQRLPNESVF